MVDILLLTVLLCFAYVNGSSAFIESSSLRKNNLGKSSATTVISPHRNLGNHVKLPKTRSTNNRNKKIMVTPAFSNTILASPVPRTHAVKTWKRRLDTHQDPFNVHKSAGFVWWATATAIFGTGTLSGFTHAPPVLESYTYLFLAATLIQAVSSVPMAIRYRANEPLVQRGFISSAIASSSSAIVGVWLSPFPLFQESILGPTAVTSIIGAMVVTDTLYSLSTLPDVQNMWKSFNLINDKQNKEEQEKTTKETNELDLLRINKQFSGFFTAIPWALPLNLILLHEMIHHADNMHKYFVETIVSHGSSLDSVYYASLVTSIAISIGNLAATLRHRKLIPKQVEDVALIGSVVVTFVFNLKAAGLY